MEDEYIRRQARAMTEAIIVCEGQTEEVFVKEVLGPALAVQNVFVKPRLIGTSQYAKGGALDGQRVQRFLHNTLRERNDIYVTTFFDLYALTPNFPGQAEAVDQKDPVGRAAAIEIGFHKAVVQEAGCRRDRFFPHIQPYEFESLLFSDTRRFAEAEPAWKTFVGQLEEARQSASSPEHINDVPNTHPSKLLDILRPKYNKVRHGRAVSARIGLDRIRAECRHFDTWLTRVETLSSLRQAE